MTADGAQIVAYVAQDEITVALVSEQGRVDGGSIRRWGRDASPTISQALIAFKESVGLRQAVVRSAIAVAGPVHGSTIAITHGRWYLTTDGLAAVLGCTPIILNDFEACAWAIIDSVGALEPLAGPRLNGSRSVARRFCIVGVDVGLGVAAFGWNEAGEPWVLSSEAGDATFPAASATTRTLVDRIAGERARCPSDLIVSHAGFEAIRRLPANPAAASSGLRGLPLGPDAHERLCATAMLEFCADLVLAFGAWDGIILTGREPARIRHALSERYAAGAMAPEGAHTRKLRAVPLAYAPSAYTPLKGAALRLAHR